jgi:hypothetical protein
MANQLMMCLSCGKKFATRQEADAHHEFFRQEELRTRHLLDRQKTSWTTTAGMMDGPPQEQYIPAHVVQISDPVGVR